MEQDHFAHRDSRRGRSDRMPLPPSSSGNCSQQVLIGDAGVHLVMSRLLSWRIPVREAMNGMPYDIIADVPGAGMYRIQVKTTTQVTKGKLRFRLQRGFHGSRRGVFDYDDSDFDLAAFVDLQKSKLLFCASPRRSINFPPEWLDLQDVEHRSWLYALKHHEEAVLQRAAQRSPPVADPRASTTAPAPAPVSPFGPFGPPGARNASSLPDASDTPCAPDAGSLPAVPIPSGLPGPPGPPTPPPPPPPPERDVSRGPRRTFVAPADEDFTP